MSTSVIILGIIFLAAICGISTVIGIRNGIVGAKNRVKRAWADVLAYQRKKLNVIPALEDGLKQYQAYEQGVLSAVTSLRTSLDRLKDETVDVAGLQQVESQTKALLSGLRVTAEAYPQLGASNLYAGWMRELSEAEENIAAAIVIFNSAVNGFNDRIQMFPGNVINANLNREQPIAAFTDSKAQAAIEYAPNL